MKLSSCLPFSTHCASPCSPAALDTFPLAKVNCMMCSKIICKDPMVGLQSHLCFQVYAINAKITAAISKVSRFKRTSQPKTM